MKKIVLICNPASGKGEKFRQIRKRIISCFDRDAVECRLVHTRRSGHACRLARKFASEVDFFTVAGGDGTIREVVAGMADDPKPIGIIPVGTMNVLARELGIPLNMEQAAVVTLKGNQRDIDVGWIGHEPFILMASIGIDASAVHMVDPDMKKLFGQFAYILAMIKASWWYRPELIRVKIGNTGQEDEGYFVLFSNSRYYGGNIVPNHSVSIDDGYLDCLIIKRPALPEAMRIAFLLVNNIPVRPEEAVFYRAQSFEVPEKHRMHVQMDGDRGLAPPFQVRIRQSYLKIFIP